MARVTLSPLVSSIKGSFGNSTIKGGKGGFVLIQKVRPKPKPEPEPPPPDK
jgi:hypothetical protein